MAQTVSLPVSAEDRVRLAEIVDDRGRLLKNIQRVGIILFSAEGPPAPGRRRRRAAPGTVWRVRSPALRRGQEPAHCRKWELGTRFDRR